MQPMTNRWKKNQRTDVHTDGISRRDFYTYRQMRQKTDLATDTQIDRNRGANMDRQIDGQIDETGRQHKTNRVR